MNTNMSGTQVNELIIKVVIQTLVTAIIVSLTTRYAVINTLNDQMIKIEMRVKNLEDRFVEKNQFEPTKLQVIENKNRINENAKQIQRHEVSIELLSKGH